MSKFNTILVAIGMVFFALAAQAQLSFTMDPSNSAPGLGEQFSVDVDVNSGFQEIASFQYTISWDQTKFSYVSLSNFGLPGLSAGSFGTTQTANGRITVSWSDPMAASQTINTDSTIYTITFDVIASGASTSDISFTSTPLSKEIITQDAMGNFDDITGSTIFNDASIDIAGGGGPDPVCDFMGFGLVVTSDSADTGDPVCLDVIACNFSEIVSFQYTTQFDPDKLQFDSLTNFNLDNLSAGNFGTTNVGNGFITSSWLDTLGAGITVTDETILYSVCFTAIGAGGDMDTVAINGALAPIEVTDANSGGSNIGLESTDGEVTITGNASSAVSVRASCEQGNPGDTVTVAISVSNFDSISGLQMSMLWDSTILEFIDTEWTGQLPGTPTFNTTSTLTDAGKLALLWDDPMGQTSSVMDDSTIFNVRYTIIGDVADVSTISFTDDPTSIEVSQVVNGTLQTVPLARIQGKVEVIGEGVLGFVIEDATGCTGDTICIPVTVDNFNEIVSMQYDFTWDDTKLDYIRTQDHNSTLEGLSAGSFNQYASDALRLSWTQALLEPRTLAEGNDTLYRVCFEVLGADGTTADLSFDETQTVEISGGDPIEIIDTYTLDNSLITVSCAMDVPMTVSDTTITNVACNGASTGAITLTLSDETGTVTFNWSNGATTQNISGLAAGSYTVTITDDNTTLIETYTITEPASALSVSMSSTDVSVNGGSDGTATATPSGGTAPYTYNWSNGGTTQTITGLTFGTYTVTVTDDNGCTISDQVAVNQPGSVTAVINSTNISCNGAADGSATVTPGGGVPGYTYLWSNGATTASVSGLTPGNYSVTVTDTNSATATASVTITQPDVLTTTLSGTDVSCNGDSDGQASVSVTGGTAGYSYLWSNGVTTDMISNVSPGTYSVTVTDMNSCTSSGSVVIGEPAAVTATISASADVSCNGADDGSATVTSGGGTGSGYTFIWSNSATTATISNLAPGTYNVTVSDSDNCTATTSITISEPAAVTAIISASSDASCNGADDGSATVTPGGGTGTGYTFAWSNGATTAAISNLAPGTYSVTVSDSDNCTATTSITISEPAAVTATISASSDASCNGADDGSATVTPGGGTGTGYTFAWSNGATTAAVSNLAPGTYSVTVSDSDNCTATTSITISEPAAVTATISASSDASCNGADDGSATVTPGGGTGTGYTFAWSNGATTAAVSNLAPGTYSVTVSDSDNCTATTSITISEPAAVNATISSSSDVSCNGAGDGSATVAPGGGTGSGYTFAWSNGATTAAISNLAPGTYTVTVSDSDNCTATTSITISEPVAVTATISSENASCGNTNGSATVTPGGGTGSGYTFAWSNGATTATINNLFPATYTVTVSDSDNCTATASVTITDVPSTVTATITASSNSSCGNNNGSATVTPGGGTGSGYTFAWSNGATTSTINNLSAGIYNVTVSDSDNCTATTSVTISDENSTVTATITASTNASCGNSNGSATVTPGGGTGSGYTFAWSNGATTSTINNLSAGIYNVTVSDSGNCTATTSVTISDENSTVTATITASTNASCGNSNGSATVTPGGGTGSGYTFTWSNGATTSTINNLSAGIYNVTVSDSEGCTGSTSVTIIEESSTVTATISSSSNTTCSGADNGSATVTPGGGSGVGYTFAWSNGATTATASNLPPSTYTVTVTDSEGCTATTSVTISEGASTVTATISSSSNTSCSGAGNGSATVTPGGGSGVGYTFAWSNGATTATASNLPPSTYTVTVTDSDGCTATTSVTISEGASTVTATISSSTDADCGSTNGSATVTPGGGSGSGYTFAWSNGATTATINNLAPGTYTVTVTDSDGCTATTVATISELGSTVTATISSSTDVSCNGADNGSATVSPGGGSGSGYTFAWSNGATTATASNLSPGTFSVTVTDSDGCTATTSVVINEGTSTVTATIASSSDVSCNGGSDGTATVSPGGGSGSGYTFAWSNGATTSTITDLIPGTYTVTVTDSDGCTGSTSVSITEPTALAATLNSTNITCNGDNDGSVTATVSGGTGAYAYVWSNGATGNAISGLSPGNYTVTITDDNGCSLTETTTITEPGLLIVTGNVSNESAANAEDGAIDITPQGGTEPWTYSWSNGATTQDISGLTPGTYSVTITDANSCTVSESFTVNPFEAPQITVESVTDVSCNGESTGQIDISVAGGVSPYTYLWSTGAITQDISGLSAGNYTITVTDDIGTTAVQTITVGQPAAITITLDGQTDVACNGDNTGSIKITASGGTPGYTYNWGNGITAEDPAGLTVGTYTVTVTDSNGCTAVGPAITIGQPNEIAITLSGTTNVACNGESTGSIEVTITGGTPGYTYAWSNGSAVQDPSGLAAGTYTLTVTDDANCMAVSSVITITEPSALSANSSSTSVSCNGAADGSINLNVAGGSPPYSYNWSGGLPNQPNHVNVDAGTYAVTITDIAGCSLVEGPIAVTQPSALTLTNSIINASASNDDGSINLMVSGGTPAYNYEWNTGETTEDLSGLASGCYVVTVTDDNGCTATDSIKVGGVIVISAETSNTSCAGLCDGSIDLTVEGGIMPYTYTWTGADVVSNAQDQNDLCAGNYAVTVVDANGTQAIQSFVIESPTALTVASSSINNETGNGCNGSIDINITGGTLPYTYQWSNGAISEDVDDLCKGDYSVTIVDANGCVLISSQFTVLPAPLVVAMSSMSMASCFGEADGEACISVLGGCGPYTVTLGTSTQVSVSGEDVCFADLAAGTYTVNVLDSGNPQMSVSQNFTISTPAPVSISSNVINNTDPSGANCDGAIDIAVTGGTVPYTYQWSNGSTSEDITNLCSGGPSFSVTVTDANGCIEILSGLEVELGLNIQVLGTENVTCFGDCDGSVDINVTGGISPYTYSWSNGGATQDLNNLCEGTYDVTVTDTNGQMASFTGIVIAGPAAALSVEMGTMERPTADNADGSISLDISGGWGGYTIEWSNGATGNPIGGLIEGFYTATVMDANGCIEVITIDLEAYRLAISSSLTTPSCNGDADGQIEVVLQGGSGDFTINWDNGQSGELAFDLDAGTYCVLIIDNQIAGLELEQCFDLTEPAELSADPIIINSSGPADGSIEANVSGGTAPYSYLWTSGDITPVTAGLTSGTYGLVVTDANGCELIIQQIEVGVEGECYQGRKVISPNGDGSNDEFIISCVEGINNNLKVFNRWGQLVYEADNYDNSWSGTDASGKVLPESGYFWVLEYEESGQTKQLKGAFTLLRGDN